MIDEADHIKFLDDILFGNFKNFDVSFIHKATVDFSLRTKTKALMFGLLHRLDNYYHRHGKDLYWTLADNYVEFIEKNFGVEEAAMAISGAKESPYNLPFDENVMPKYKNFLDKNSHYFGNHNV